MWLEYLSKFLRWLIIDKGNNSGSTGFHEFNIGGRDVRDAGGVAEAAGGTVARVAQDSDHRTVVKVGVRSGATRRWTQWVIIVEFTRQKNVAPLGSSGEKACEEGNKEEKTANIVEVWHVGEMGAKCVCVWVSHAKEEEDGGLFMVLSVRELPLTNYLFKSFKLALTVKRPIFLTYITKIGFIIDWAISLA